MGRRSAAGAATIGFVLCLAGPVGASPSTTQPAQTVATGRAIAQAINLTSVDLPGWTESPNPPTPGDQSLNAQMSACAGGPKPSSIDVIDVTSANFDKGPIELNSDVTMVKTHEDGLADFRAFTGHRSLTCFYKIFPRFLKQQIPGVRVSNLKVNFFKPTEAVQDAFGLAFSITMSGKTQNGKARTLHLSGHEIGFLVGSAELTLGEDFTGSPRPVPNEASLVQLLDQRALHNQAS
jgi:hypothetical protein